MELSFATELVLCDSRECTTLTHDQHRKAVLLLSYHAPTALRIGAMLCSQGIGGHI